MPIVDADGTVVGVLFDPTDMAEGIAIVTDPDGLEGIREARADVAAGRVVRSDVIAADLKARQDHS
ncbi:MAG: hypothetical protein ACR2JF_08240 [Iamia sp.]